VDKLAEARRVFVDQLTGTLQVIARDVKIQVDFDPDVVARYRLIGYENRALGARDFDNDRVDAGEIGAGHSVTAVYEVRLHPDRNGALGKVRVRYKQPTGGSSELIEQSLVRSVVRSSADALSSPAKLSLAAAQWGEKLRGSYWARNVSYDDIAERLEGLSTRLKNQTQVKELERLVRKAKELDRRGDKFERHGPIASMNFDKVPVLR
jgi:Ca-activated chloride channel family protein